MVTKWCTKLETAKERCPIVFQGHLSNFKVTRYKTSPILTQIGRFQTIGRSQLSNPSDLPCLWLDWLLYVVWFFFRNRKIPNFYSTERSHLCCFCFEMLIALMFPCTNIVLKVSSCATFSVIFATRASIICIDSGTRDTICVSLAVAIRFFDISINRYTPTDYQFLQFWLNIRCTWPVSYKNIIYSEQY